MRRARRPEGHRFRVPGSTAIPLGSPSILVLGCLVLGGCDHPAPSAQGSASRAQARQPAESVRFDPRDAIDTSATPIHALLAAETIDDTLTLAGSILARGSAPQIAGEARWIAGRRAAREGRWGEARRHLAPLASSEHALGSWAALTLAEGLVQHTPAEAANLAARVASQDWTGRGRARRIEAQALRNAERPSDALARYQSLLADLDEDTADSTVLIPVAELLLETQPDDQQGDVRETALALYRRVLVNSHSPDTLEDVRTRIDEILRALPAATSPKPS